MRMKDLTIETLKASRTCSEKELPVGCLIKVAASFCRAGQQLIAPVMLLALAFLSTEQRALADSNHRFPGVGNREVWLRSHDFAAESINCSKKGDYESAIKYDKQALAMYPYESRWYHNLACDLVSAKRYKEAIAAGKKAVN